MGRHKGFKHSEATKLKIAQRTKAALSGDVAVAERPIAAPQAGKDHGTAPSQEGHASGSAVAAKDALDALALGPVKDVIALMLWKNRHNDPEMAVKLTEHDLNGFRACIGYLNVMPDVRIFRPQGMPGHEGMPATAKRSAIPPMEATPPKPYVIITLVEKGTENAIKAVENNEEDYKAAEEAKAFRHARDIALQIASQLQRDNATGNYSSATVNEACACLVALAR